MIKSSCVCFRPLVKKVLLKINFLIFKQNRYVAGSQKNSLNEIVLLSIQNISQN